MFKLGNQQKVPTKSLKCYTKFKPKVHKVQPSKLKLDFSAINTVILKALSGLSLVTCVTSKHSTSLHLTLEHFLEHILFEMPRKMYHSQVTRHYLLSMILHDIILPTPDHDLDQLTKNIAWFSASQLIGGMEALFLVMIWEILGTVCGSSIV